MKPIKESSAFSNGMEAQLPAEGSIKEAGNRMIMRILLLGMN